MSKVNEYHWLKSALQHKNIYISVQLNIQHRFCTDDCFLVGWVEMLHCDLGYFFDKDQLNRLQCAFIWN